MVLTLSETSEPVLGGSADPGDAHRLAVDTGRPLLPGGRGAAASWIARVPGLGPARV